jgi:hypothetical protein
LWTFFVQIYNFVQANPLSCWYTKQLGVSIFIWCVKENNVRPAMPYWNGMKITGLKSHKKFGIWKRIVGAIKAMSLSKRKTHKRRKYECGFLILLGSYVYLINQTWHDRKCFCWINIAMIPYVNIRVFYKQSGCIVYT